MKNPSALITTKDEEREIPESLKHLFACNETITLNEVIHENNSLDKSKKVTAKPTVDKNVVFFNKSQ